MHIQRTRSPLFFFFLFHFCLRSLLSGFQNLCARIDNLCTDVYYLFTLSLSPSFPHRLDSGLWTSLMARGTPVNLQEHSMIYWNDCLYVFGGVFAQAGECPLWIYRIQVKNTAGNVTWKKKINKSLVISSLHYRTAPGISGNARKDTEPLNPGRLTRRPLTGT